MSWWDAPSASADVGSSTSVVPANDAPSARTAGQVLKLKKSFRVRVAALMHEVWWEVVADSIDSLCRQIEEKLIRDRRFEFTDLLYLLCKSEEAAGDSASRPALSFILCSSRPHSREVVRKVLARKGKQLGVNLPVLHDETPFDVAVATLGEGRMSAFRERSSFQQVSSLLPDSFTCVVRCMPRRIQFRLIILSSFDARRRLTSASPNGNSSPSRWDGGTQRYRIPDTEELNDMATVHGLAQSRGSVDNVTSLSELLNGVMDHVALTHGSDYRTTNHDMQLWFTNPGKRPAFARHFEPLVHIGQVAGLVCLLIDVADDDATDRCPPERSAAPRAVNASAGSNTDSAKGTFAAIKQRISSHRSRQANVSNTQTVVSVHSSSPSYRDTSTHTEPSFSAAESRQRRRSASPRMEVLSAPSRSPPRDDTSRMRSLFSADHLWRLGLGADDALALKHEELESAAAILQDDVRHLLDTNRAASDASSQWLVSSVLDDAARERRTRFPLDYRSERPRASGASSPARRLQTPAPASTSAQYGHSYLTATAAANDGEERRLLIQAALQLSMTCAHKHMFPTTSLVTMVPEIVTKFRAEYAVGVPIRFPLSARDLAALGRIVNDCLEYYARSRPDLLLPTSRTFGVLDSASPRRSRDGSPNFSEFDAAPPLEPDIPPLAGQVAHATSDLRALVLARPQFDAASKRLVVFATVGVDLFGSGSAALNQTNQPYYQQRGVEHAPMPFRWFLRTARTSFSQQSVELPIDTFFALGIAKTFVLSYDVPITIGLEVLLDPQQDFSFIAEGMERVLVHRWRGGGVSSVFEEGQPYVVGIEIRHRETPQSSDRAVQAVQSFVIPVDSGTAPLSRQQLYTMLHY